ncbi:uncharacterized protein TNCV_4158201 [Trichonephila clavipes]|nr:uncharacterized protein TNCV_4158201 [Trichonephila clavipes]
MDGKCDLRVNSDRLFESDPHVTSTTTTTATPSVRSIPLAVGRSLSHQADNMDHRDFRSSCLARTPSGSLFIPSECKVPASPLNCHLSSQLSKAVNESKTNPERCHLSYTSGVPVPVCNNVRRSSPGHYSRFQFRKSFSSRCTWKCTAIVCLFISLAILSALAYFVDKSDHPWPVAVAGLGRFRYSTPSPVSGWIGKRTRYLIWRACVLLLSIGVASSESDDFGR